MADELNIVVKEDGTQQVVRDFTALAAASNATAKGVDRLKSSLQGLDSVGSSLSSVTKFANQAASITTQMDALAVATEKVSTSQARLIRTYSAAMLAQEKVRTQQQRTQVEMAKAEYWLNKAADAEERAGISSQKLAAAQMKASTEAQKLATAQQQTQKAIAQTTAAQHQATAAAGQAAAAQQRLATEQARTSGATAAAATAATKAATAEQNLTNATARAQAASVSAAVAQKRLESATNASATSAANLVTAQNRAQASTLRLEQAQQRAAGSSGAYQREIDALRSKLYPTEVAQEKVNAELARAKVLFDQGKISAKMYGDSVRYASLKTRELRDPMAVANGGMVQMRNGARLARHEMINLGYQIQDIGVSLASGQKPLTVFIQQGAQIAGIASSAGISLKAMGFEMLKMVGRFWKPIAAVLAFIGAMTSLRSEMAKGANMDQYVQTLGLTNKELKKLEDQTITYGDVAMGVFATVGELWSNLLDQLEQDFGLVSAFDDLADQASEALGTIWDDWLLYSNAVNAKLYAQVVATYKTIVALWKSWPAVFSDLWVQAINSAINQIEELINISIVGINKPMEAFNKLMHKTGRGFRFELFEGINLERQVNEHAGAAANITKTYDDAYQAAYKDGFTFADKLGNMLEKNIVGAAQKRLRDEANKIIADRSGNDKASTEMEKLEAALARVRGEVSPADQALRRLAEANDILNKSVAKGLISQAEADKVMQRLRDRYEDQIDPIGKLTRELDQQIGALGKLPPVMEIHNQMLRIENDLKAKNVELTGRQRQQIMGQLEELQKRNEIQGQFNTIYGQTVGMEREYIAQQAALNQARQMGILSAEQYGIKMNNLAISAARLRLEMGRPLDGDALTASMGGLLEGYQGVLLGLTDAFGELFVTITDGFADSIGSAIVEGENLGDALTNVAQGAMKELISSFVKLGVQYAMNAAIQQTAITTTTATSTAAAASTTAAWTPAAAVASIGSFGTAATIGIGALLAAMALAKGFKSGGYTGGKGQSEIAGVVHGQEFVMDAQSTRRIGVGNLQALQDGTASINGGGGGFVAVGAGPGGGNTYVNIINNANNSEVTTEKTEDENGNVSYSVMINTIENTLASRVSSGQGPLHKSIGSAYNVKPMPSGR